MVKFSKTLNDMGYHAYTLDDYTKEFIEHIAVLGDKGTNLEIGCGFGTAAISALQKGAQLHCNDLEIKHLEILQQQLIEQELERCQIHVGDFRSLQFADEFFDTILASRMLHFLPPAEVNDALTLIYHWLKPGGQLYLVVATPFVRVWKSCLPTYFANKKAGKQWPGDINDFSQFNDESLQYSVKNLMLYDIDTLVSCFNQAHFTVEKVGYIDRRGSFPDDTLFDGRENLGIIGKKLA